MKLKYRQQSGFTLIELLVVIAIIGVLASVVLTGMQSAREAALDARRKSDVDQIIKALVLYQVKEGERLFIDSGCGFEGDAQGWFNYTGGVYPKSIAECLVEAGAASAIITDPEGGVTSIPTSGNTYMKYTCTRNGDLKTYIYAKLDTVTQSVTATDDTCCPSCDSSYGMNYYKQI